MATADAEKTAEIALADADLTLATATAAANAQLSLATAQATLIAALGAGGSYRATYPELSEAPDLAARYAVPAAWNWCQNRPPPRRRI